MASRFQIPVSSQTATALIVLTLAAWTIWSTASRMAAREVTADARIEDGRIVTYVASPVAFGRIRAGQRGQMEMHGFPSAQYGYVDAAVANVAPDVHGGKVRVELRVLSSGKLKLQSGMPGQLALAVEPVSPVTLLLRTAAGLLSQPVSACLNSPLS